MYDPDERLAAVARAVLVRPRRGSTRYRAAQRARVARIDAHAHGRSSTTRARRARRCAAASAGSDDWRRLAQARGAPRVHDDLPHARRPGVPRPDDRSRRPAARIAVRVPRSVRRELRAGRAGAHDDVARLAVDVVGPVVAGASSRTRCRRCTCPSLVVHPTADTEIRIRQAREIADAAGSDDVTYDEIAGRAALPRRPPPRRRWRSSPTGSAPASRRCPRLTCGSPGTKKR